MDAHVNEVTRYFCAAVHLSTTLRNKVLTILLHEKHRAIAPSTGLDLSCVLFHSLYARRRKFVRDIALVLLGIILSFLYVTDIPDAYLPTILVILTAYFVILYERWTTQFNVVANNLGKTGIDSAHQLFNSDTNSNYRKANRYIEESQRGNVVVYSGFSPFVGAGFELGGWSFALNIEKGKSDLGMSLEPAHFETKELYSHIDNAINLLKVDGITVEDKLYVNGQDIRSNQTFLESPLGRPTSNVSPELLEHCISYPFPTFRHYRCYRVTTWRGELTLSIFLRLTKTGQCLFAETSYFLLTPVSSDLRKVDTLLSDQSMRQTLGFLLQTTLITPFAMLLAPMAVVGRFFEPIAEWLRERELVKHITENPLFDYGGGASLRVQHSSDSYKSYFQKLDREMYAKIVERTILDSMITFLDEKNIDTSDLRERQTSILNNGVIVTGGAIQAESLTVGHSAKSVLQRTKSAVQSVKGQPKAA